MTEYLSACNIEQFTYSHWLQWLMWNECMTTEGEWMDGQRWWPRSHAIASQNWADSKTRNKVITGQKWAGIGPVLALLWPGFWVTHGMDKHVMDNTALLSPDSRLTVLISARTTPLLAQNWPHSGTFSEWPMCGTWGQTSHFLVLFTAD